jgi:small basic protein (TIGR04137 family)
MSLDPSLKTKGKLSGTRSVMTRAERVQELAKSKRLDPKKDKALGLPKTKVVE